MPRAVCEDSAGLRPTTMEIPRYLLENAVRHMERVADNCRASPDDSRTANALRLLRRDITNLKRHLTAKQ